MTTQRKILNEIKTAGYKLTPQRRTIIGAMIGSGAPTTPQALHAALLPEHPDIGLVTVYRTIELLQKLGLLCRFQHDDSTVTTFKAGPPEHHHHLVCRSCGEVVNLSGHCPVELEAALERETGYRITEHQLAFSGYCRNCRKD
ncbi:ferric uptake regulation protein [Dehalogenimonas sp. WBC-2]|nr:ferric uptake regulation protein [Dehalogenimonas sp. WBC-2]